MARYGQRACAPCAALTQTGPLANQTGRIREVIGALAIFGAVYFLLNTGFIAVAVAHERQAGIDLYRITHVPGTELRGEQVRFEWRF